MTNSPTPAGAPGLRVVGREFANNSNSLKGTLTQLWRYTGEAVYAANREALIMRIRVVRDPYEMQSYAIAEVLADNKTWTHMISIPAVYWHEDTRTETDFNSVHDKLFAHLLHIFDLHA